MRASNVRMNVVIAADSQELAQKTLKLFVVDARKAIETRRRFCAAISRDAPSAFFELLGTKPQSKALPWDKIHLFRVDQCCSPRGSEDENHTASSSAFIYKTGIAAENVHSICSGSRDCGFAAAIYEQTICNVVNLRENGIPRFDLVLLRMYADGHIASLFPDTYAFFDTKALVRIIYFMDSRHTRITLTNPVLCAALHIIVLVSGVDKAAILREVLAGEPDQVRYPIHAVWPVFDRITWLVELNGKDAR